MVLVTGVTGQLGFEVVKELEKRNIPCLGVGRSDFDLRNKEEVFDFVGKSKAEAIIHCAAYTQVDKGEEEVALCCEINGEGTSYLAESAKEIGAKMLFVSTDYVFSGEGDQPFSVDSPTNPLNVYGFSKRDGEEAVRKYLEKYFILRVSWLFGQNGQNFVKTMLRLGAEKESLSVVADQIGSPTYAVDVAKLICDMIQSEKYGVYHGTNEGFCSWADFAREIMKQAGLNCAIKGITSAEYPTKATRPKNSRLDKGKLAEAGFSPLPTWEEGLSSFLKERGI